MDLSCIEAYAIVCKILHCVYIITEHTPHRFYAFLLVFLKSDL